MNISRRIGLALLATTLGVTALELGALVVPAMPRFVSEAEAVVGRPLTPVSVAGVGRRTARRCAAGVYNC
jgi:hypothetical protein